MTTTIPSAQGPHTVRITEHVRITPDGNEVAVSVYEQSAVICCESRLDRRQVADLVNELVAWLAAPAAKPAPEYWPPRLGDIWQDREGRRWVAARHRNTSYLECLAMEADDSADEINQMYGPMKLHSRPQVREEGCPF